MLLTALNIAQKNRHKRYNHVAILYKGGSIFAAATNDHEQHAEDLALCVAEARNWPSNFNGAYMLSIRINTKGFLAMARPCAKCWELLRGYGIRKVTYSSRDGSMVTERIK